MHDTNAPLFDPYLDKMAVYLYMFCSIVMNKVMGDGDGNLVFTIILHRLISHKFQII